MALPYSVAPRPPPESSPRNTESRACKRAALPETEVIMSAEPAVLLGARVIDRARSSREKSPFVLPSSRGIDRCVPSTTRDARHARSFVRRASERRERARITAARLVLSTRTNSAPTSHGRVVAARKEATRRATASFVENLALAVERVSGGINHDTVRNESNPRVRAASILPTTQTRGRQESSSRVTPSRLAVLSPMFPRARPSRSDRTSVGCSSREDQGGPP